MLSTFRSLRTGAVHAFSLAPLVASGQEYERETLRLDEATTRDETATDVGQC